MKSTLFAFLLLASVFSAQKVQAQEFYIRAGGGYSGESGKTEFNNADPNGITQIQQSADITVSADGATTNVKALNGTLGDGYKFNLTGGYMFNPHIGAELGINYFHGNKKLIGRFGSPQVRSEENAYIRGVDLMPAIYITPAFAKLNPYARMGVILTGGGKLKIETNVLQPNGGGAGTDIHVTALSEVKSKFSAGFAGAVGVTYPLADKLSLFGEVEFKNFSIKSKSAEIVSYETTAVTNGQANSVPGQQLADLPISEKKFEFSDNFSQGTSSPPNESQPRKIPTQFVNASGAGVNIGVRYTF